MSGKNVWIIGVDSDQYEDGIYADGKSAVLTSMVKKVENSVFDGITRVNENTWEGGLIVQNLLNGGVGYSKANSELSKEAISAADKASEDIKSGKIVVDKTYKDALSKGLVPNTLGAIDD